MLVSMQLPPHIMRGDAQLVVDMQEPLLQNWPEGQAVPQAPQLAMSVRVSTQAPEQSVRGAVHIEVGAHTPLLQKLPEGQALPQVPQLALSLRVSTQIEPHIARGAVQAEGTSVPGLPVSVGGVPESVCGLPVSSGGVPVSTTGLPVSVGGVPESTCGLPVSSVVMGPVPPVPRAEQAAPPRAAQSERRRKGLNRRDIGTAYLRSRRWSGRGGAHTRQIASKVKEGPGARGAWVTAADVERVRAMARRESQREALRGRRERSASRTPSAR